MRGDCRSRPPVPGPYGIKLHARLKSKATPIHFIFCKYSILSGPKITSNVSSLNETAAVIAILRAMGLRKAASGEQKEEEERTVKGASRSDFCRRQRTERG